MQVPSSLQYPLERERDLQRRWSRLLQRTLSTPERAFVPLRQAHAEPSPQKLLRSEHQPYRCSRPA
jgi:hypothetical protein